MNLNLSVIRSYNFPETNTTPDHDDRGIDFTLPNGLVLGTLTICYNSPTVADSLEGLDGYIYITTTDELDALLELTYEDICQDIANKNPEFDINEYI